MADPDRKRRLLDLDAARAEAALEPLEVQLRGRVFTLPPTMPVGLPIFLNRAVTAATSQEEDQAASAAMESLFGDRGEEAMRAGFTIGDLIRIAASYGVTEDGADPESPAGASPASAPPSKPAGRNSKPASKPTTASTSEPSASAPTPAATGSATSSP